MREIFYRSGNNPGGRKIDHGRIDLEKFYSAVVKYIISDDINNKSLRDKAQYDIMDALEPKFDNSGKMVRTLPATTGGLKAIFT